MIHIAGKNDIVQGELIFNKVNCDPRISYFLYIPNSLKKIDKMLVAVHGISRNALQQAEAYQPLAEQLGMPLIAPIFDQKNFSGFQTLCIGRKGLRADVMLFKVFSEVKRQLDTFNPAFHLIGYSGGAQFIHRFALGYPKSIHSMTLCSAGWYTFPDPDTRYPRGLSMEKIWPDYQPDLKAFLRVPLQIIIGGEDVVQESSLNCRQSINRQQGFNRLERAGNWHEAISDAKKQFGIESPIKMTILENQSHDFQQNIKESDMMSYIFEFISKRTSKNEADQ